MKILIVDDEPLFLELMQVTLQELGYEDISLALSAKDAFANIDAAPNPFDCILLDIQMPEVNGIELCAGIRGLPDYSATPILMVTAMTEKHYINRAFQAGANDYVTKPIEPIEIKARMNMVKRLLSERNQAVWLHNQLHEAEAAFGMQIAFDEPCILPEVQWVLPMSSLENYVLRLGNMRMFSTVALGFHIENGPTIFSKSRGMEFVDCLSEVALAISEVLPRSPSFLSYAGSGDFCAVIPKLSQLDPSFLGMRINDSLSQLTHNSCGAFEVPQVRVGRPQSNGLLSFRDPASVLTRAIEDARTPTAQKKTFRRSYEKHEW